MSRNLIFPVHIDDTFFQIVIFCWLSLIILFFAGIIFIMIDAYIQCGVWACTQISHTKTT